jgi:hypothetical protein
VVLGPEQNQAMSTGVRYIAIGFTQGLSSKAFIGRYKSEKELRDVFELEKLSRYAARRLYVFKVCRAIEVECLWIVSFDVKEVRVRDPKRAAKAYRKPSHEYHDIKEMLFSYLCGSVDASTYICFEDYASLVETYLAKVTEPSKFKVESFYVKPYSDKERVFAREAILRTIEWLVAKSIALAAKIEKVDKRAFWRVERSAREFLSSIAIAEKSINSISEKAKALGIGLDLRDVLRDAKTRIEKALETRKNLAVEERRK